MRHRATPNFCSISTDCPQVFVDLHVLVDGVQSLRTVHDRTEQIEQIIAKIAPDADVTVHPEPV